MNGTLIHPCRSHLSKKRRIELLEMDALQKVHKLQQENAELRDLLFKVAAAAGLHVEHKGPVAAHWVVEKLTPVKRRELEKRQKQLAKQQAADLTGHPQTAGLMGQHPRGLT
jgi:hypothetical protein